MSKFSEIRDFIRNKEVGELFYRRELMAINNTATSDFYRRKLQICGYINTVDPGIYVILKEIPKDFTTSKMDKEWVIAKNTNPRFIYKNKRLKLSIRDIFNAPKLWLNLYKDTINGADRNSY